MADITITATGTGFVNGCTALLGPSQVEATTTFVSATSCTFPIDPDVWPVGPLDVIIENIDAQRTAAVQFTVIAAAPAPTLTSINPNSGTQDPGA